MKNTKIYFFIVCMMFLHSCNDELDLVPLDRVTASTFYNTRGDFDSAIFASYSSIQDFWGTSTETLSEDGEYWKITVIISDDAEQNGSTSPDSRTIDADNLQIRASDLAYQAIFTQLYEGIARANIVLGNLDGDNELSAEDKTVLDAEAKFLRAWFHFQALKLFGTPPLVTEVLSDINNLVQPNATQDALYTAILADLAAAASGLPESWDSNNTGRATSWTARSYIGKVNVFKEDWPTAITALAEVVNSGPYSLVTSDDPEVSDYEAVFSFENENNSESIFEIQFGGPRSDDNIWVFDDTHSENFKASQGIARGYYWDAPGDVGAPGGNRGWFVPTEDLVNAFEAGDTRLAATVFADGEDYITFNRAGAVDEPYDPAWSSSGFTGKKLRGPSNADSSNHSPNGIADFNNERWFRFAELKLLYAEALIRGSGDAAIAEQQINDIRNRAGLADLAGGSDLLAAMMQEKRVEMALEPHRWFDIVRWDLGPSIFGDSWDPKFEVFPFPQSEVDRAGGALNQNLGY
ncbi:RagB/SusD family nutrient uptake outer membrane protein [Allomuricauda sp. R78024]|uniref:RagB/SusD family nutrient uptake outer membrane protein n=1 Tax=Allomuricauda sp. R78024 TaxID=3093867 RepID=UPI0037C912BE